MVSQHTFGVSEQRWTGRWWKKQKSLSRWAPDPLPCFSWSSSTFLIVSVTFLHTTLLEEKFLPLTATKYLKNSSLNNIFTENIQSACSARKVYSLSLVLCLLSVHNIQKKKKNTGHLLGAITLQDAVRTWLHLIFANSVMRLSSPSCTDEEKHSRCGTCPTSHKCWKQRL